MPQYRLIVTEGSGSKGNAVTLDGGEVLIGRLRSNGLVLDGDTVSRRHAKVIADDTGVFVEDLKSKGGTRVNGSDVTRRVQLSSGDEVQIEGFRVLFEEITPAAVFQGGLGDDDDYEEDMTEALVMDEAPDLDEAEGPSPAAPPALSGEGGEGDLAAEDADAGAQDAGGHDEDDIVPGTTSFLGDDGEGGSDAAEPPPEDGTEVMPFDGEGPQPEEMTEELSGLATDGATDEGEAGDAIDFTEQTMHMSDVQDGGWDGDDSGTFAGISGDGEIGDGAEGPESGGTVALGGSNTIHMDEHELESMLEGDRQRRRSRKVFLLIGLVVAALVAFVVLRKPKTESVSFDPVRKYMAVDKTFLLYTDEALIQALTPVGDSGSTYVADAAVGGTRSTRVRLVLLRGVDPAYQRKDLSTLLREVLPSLRGIAVEYSTAGQSDEVMLADARLVPALRYSFTSSGRGYGAMKGKGFIWRSGPNLHAVEFSASSDDMRMLDRSIEHSLGSYQIEDKLLQLQFVPPPPPSVLKAVEKKSDKDVWDSAKSLAQRGRRLFVSGQQYPAKLADADRTMVAALQELIAAGKTMDGGDVDEWRQVLSDVREKRVQAYRDCKFRIDQAERLKRYRYAKEVAEYGMTLFQKDDCCRWYRYNLNEEAQRLGRKAN